MNIEHHLHVVDNEDEVNRLIWSLTSRGFTLRWDRPYSKSLEKGGVTHLIIDSDHADNAMHWACAYRFSHINIREKLTEKGLMYLLCLIRGDYQWSELFVMNEDLTKGLREIYPKYEGTDEEHPEALRQIYKLLDEHDAVY